MADRIEQELIVMLPRLRRFAYGLVGNMDEADDLLQEACAKAIENATSWAQGTRLDSWMYRIIQNTWKDSRRRNNVRARNSEKLQHHMDQQVDAETQIEDRMTLDKVRLAMDQLPDDQRVIVTMTCLEGVSYKQAAEILDLPIGTVMSRLSRGRRALQKMLEV